MKANLENNFTYHPPVGADIKFYAYLRDQVKRLATDYVDLLPPSRELSLALTKLEESIMWANAARARYDKNGNPKIPMRSDAEKTEIFNDSIVDRLSGSPS